MANSSEYTVNDLARIFFLKFLTQDDLDDYEDGSFSVGGFLDATSGAIEVDTTVGTNE